MTLKSNISDMKISVPVVEFAHILALATRYDVIRQQLKCTEEKVVRMRNELTNYQAKFERDNAAAANDADDGNGEHLTPQSVADVIITIVGKVGENV